MERSLDLVVVLAMFGTGIVAFVVGLVIGSSRNDTKPIARAAQSGLLCFVGGYAAHVFVNALLHAGDDSRGASLLVGWLFLLIPGIVDTVATHVADGARPLTSPDVMPWLAAAVGAFTGFMNGVHKIHDWDRLGVPQFVADVTWGLAGSVTASLLHLWCLPMRGWVEEPGTGAHRYEKGFHFPGKPDFAFTQGCVMSNLKNPPTDALWKHERTHTFQSRAFGPLFTVSYLGWMGLWLIPSAIYSLAKRQNLSLVEVWTYFNNPWEAWGYHVQHAHDVSMQPAGVATAPRDFRLQDYVTGAGWVNREAWPYSTVWLLTIPYAVVCVGVLLLLLVAAY